LSNYHNSFTRRSTEGMPCSFPWSPCGVGVCKDNKACETGKTLPVKPPQDALLYQQIISRASLKAAS